MKGAALKSLVDDLFTVVKDRSTQDELVFVCPQPGCGDTSGNRSVNLKSGKTGCWRCGKGGDFVRWARGLGYNIEDGFSHQAVPLEEINVTQDVDKADILPTVANIKMPDGFTYCHVRLKSVYTELISEMAERKNLAIKDLMKAKVGFTKLDPKWEPYAIFPCFEYGEIVYYQGRTYVDTPGESTKLFPTRQEAPYGARFWVYGIDELRAAKCGVAIVVESILNVLSLRKYMLEHNLSGAVPVCVFKHYLSRAQARKLMQIKHLDEICLLYDHDATAASWEKAPLIADRVKVTVAEMPPGPGGTKNDPNDDAETAWRVFTERKRSDGLSAVMAKANGNFSSYAKAKESALGHFTPIDVLQSLSL